MRIVCLSAEAADWLWRIGAWDKVVGVTHFFSQPPGAARKPKVSGFSHASLPAIERLKPDLVITFSDVQANLAAELIRRGLPVLATNQRTLQEIKETLAWLARTVDHKATPLAEFRRRLKPVKAPPQRPRIYFEEWNDPLICGIGWVSELIERAGGKDVFANKSSGGRSQQRELTWQEVVAADPEIIFASWCGKPVRKQEIANRKGWQKVSAVRNGQIYEIKSRHILQPGFAILQGYELMKATIAGYLAEGAR